MVSPSASRGAWASLMMNTLWERLDSLLSRVFATFLFFWPGSKIWKHIYQHVGSFNINLNHCETFKAQNSNSSMTCSERRLTEVIPWSESTRRATIPGQSHLWSSAQRFPPRLWHIHLLIFDSGTQMILKLTSPKHLKCLLRRFDFNLHTAGHVHVVILILSENFRLRWSSLRR